VQRTPYGPIRQATCKTGSLLCNKWNLMLSLILLYCYFHCCSYCYCYTLTLHSLFWTLLRSTISGKIQASESGLPSRGFVTPAATPLSVTKLPSEHPQLMSPTPLQIRINKPMGLYSAEMRHINILCQISGSHGGEYEDESLLRYSAV
jgi:hypothetical protein